MNIVHQRLLSQQLVSPQFETPLEVVEWMGAIQAQDYKMIRWAVCSRTRHPSIQQFEKAYNEGEIIRTHLLRGTWHLVSGKDLPWMLAICSERVKRGFYSRMKANKVEITEDEIQEYREILKKAFHQKHSVTKDDFKAVFAKEGIEINDQRISYHIRLAEIDGILCSGDLTSTVSPTYSLVSEKLKRFKEEEATAPKLSYDEALKRLTLRYFRSHSPATLEDFVWWTGCSKMECKKGIESLKGEIIEKTYENQTFYVYQDGRTKGVPKTSVLLLSPYDEYLIGYKSRNIVLKPEYQHHAHNRTGIFYPIFAIQGHIQGNWKPRSKDGDFKFFTKKTSHKSSLAKAFQEFKAWGGI